MIGFLHQWWLDASTKSLFEWFGFSFGLTIVIVAWLLIPPILYPTVIEYPWQLPSNQSERNKDKQRIVVLAGSFNPPHNGHLAMLQYLSQRYVFLRARYIVACVHQKLNLHPILILGRLILFFFLSSFLLLYTVGIVK